MNPQLTASDPATSAFVAANAGSGKTTTLVNRVARLLLRGAEPEAILCLTYTKAAAAEMQRRLFETLGGWSTQDDDGLAAELAKIGEGRRDLPRARTLFARALETPGGLKIQTIHAFCEKLLRRFPLEAGVSPGFTVLEGAAQGEVQQHARELLAELALAQPPVGESYAHFAVELAPGDFDGLLCAFEAEREGLAAFLARDGWIGDVWRTCGFPSGEPADPQALEADAVGACDWARWRGAAEALIATGSSSDDKLARKLLNLVECAATRPGGFSDCLAVFSTSDGARSKILGTKALDPRQRDWLVEEQDRLHGACDRARAARQAIDTVHALTLAAAYVGFYAGAKEDRGALDFADLVQLTEELLTVRADAAWVLYKLDGGVDHVLVDEAQDTSPEQWDIVRALTADFFAGDGVRAAGGGRRLERTVFAVGDEKQSIYGFQGAEPELLHREAQRYDALAVAAGRAFASPALLESWRSTDEVLGFVDTLGADDGFRDGVQPAASNVLHHPRGRRDDTPGQVDLWPLFQDTPREEPAAWDAPLDADTGVSAVKALARALAEKVGDMSARGEAVWDKKLGRLRPVRPGDVLILVRRRGPLFEEILRELKRAGLPVAGADRLKLSDHVAFDDVLALVRFVLFPWDDLTLAALLRSPFCGVDEEALFDLAHGRGEVTLWAELSRRGDERPEWREARRFLGDMREAARGRGPFDMLGRCLGWLDGEGRTVRQRVVTRLGVEAGEALDELLAYALAAEARGVTDLERFAGELGRAEVEVKRELEGADADDGPLFTRMGAVRVMTVHGAKGLEAPVVILPDTNGGLARSRDGLLKTGAIDAQGEWRTDGGYLFAPREKEDTPASADARAHRKGREAHEQLRLLYVALTRARDRVIVAGRIGARDKGPTKGGWYERIAAAFDRAEEGGGDLVREVRDGPRLIRRFGRDPAFALDSGETAPAPDAAPAWLREAAPPEPESSRYASPSTFAEGRRGPAPSPLATTVGGLGRFRRGELIHRLLQLLPDLPAAERPAAAERILARERDLHDDQRREMARAALAVLEDPRFAQVWAPGSKAEAAVAGSAPELPEGLAISGRVDRLLVTPERVMVVDFKTNRPSPDRIEAADPAYIAQMAIYAAVLRAVFPGRRVEAALVWTDGPKLMPVPDNVMDAALQRIRAGR